TYNTQLIMSGMGRDEFPIPESKAMADYVEALAIPKSAIREEGLSKDTIQNAYFTRLLFLDRQDVKEFTVVTNDFHLNRAKHIFNWVFGEGYDIHFVGSSDESIDPKDLEIRMKTEGELLGYHEEHLSKGIEPGDMEAVRSFIFDLEDANAVAYRKFTEPYSHIKALY
ncbi:MAG: YdcF family protein, partial [Flavobacteriales bacterium]|nr:YdcF family protein [Flavobacteriales bacterium]